MDDTARWLRKHRIDHPDALYGLSYGGGMAIRFLVTQDIPAEKAIIDGGTAQPTHDHRSLLNILYFAALLW